MDFVKYQGTGNDFILIDARTENYDNLNVLTICDRRFGIGADGLMLLKNKPNYDFEMVYYNSDGNLSSMCGNGGRCIAHFAHGLGLGANNSVRFLATDGDHNATIQNNEVALTMRDVGEWELKDTNTMVLNTGSPHFVHFIETDPDAMDLIGFAHSVRYNEEYNQVGINVNIVQQTGANMLKMRTYERGVEDETLSCGTGVTAAALALQIKTGYDLATVQVETAGGVLQVLSKKNGALYSEIVLIGPAIPVFTGHIK